LRHSDSIAVRKIVAFNVGPKTCKCDTTDDGLVRLAGTVPPSIVVVEAATQRGQSRLDAKVDLAYPAVNISIKCCSVVPGSSLFLRPEKIPSCLSRASPAALFTSIISGWVMSRCGGMA